MFCGKCGAQVPDENKFCSGCGSPMNGTSSPQITTPPTSEKKEKVYFRGEGELIIRTTKHHGAGRKVGSWLLGGPIGYAVIGRDSKRTTKAKGTLIVTEKAIYCAGNEYPFDKIIATTIKGTIQKKINVTLDKDVGGGGRGQGVGGGDRISVEIEISTDDINGLFKGLEQARMGKVEF
ncbi:MAG: zinc ribbon domain-containing protein [Nitrosarchaeum sp.]|nr:zinc ribbon domain-containing protein [Nitrosarchaeum sp.]